MRVNRMLLLPAVPAKTGYTGFRLSSCWPRMALAAGLLLCWLHGAARAEGTQDVSALVETGAVQHTEMQGTVSGYGAVVPAPGAMLNLNFAMAGTVTRVRVTPGQRVTRGMTLLEANATPQTELAQRQAAHAVAYAQGEMARVQAPVNLDVPGFGDPVSGMLLTLPDSRGAPNQLYLRAGRLPGPDEDNAVVINEAFAEAHHLQPGTRLAATINGRWKQLTVTGVVLSPEFVYLIRPGDFFPDYKRYGVLWMNRRPLAAAYGMDGAFNNVALTLAPGASLPVVISRLDTLLARWGGVGAIGRTDQTSHHYLSEEIKQLQSQATIVPIIFMGVAAFLLNVVLSRLIRQQRIPMAILKAFGYSNTAIMLHYMKLVTAIVLIGSVIGIGAGSWLAHGLSNIYGEFFRYPYMHYVLRPGVAFIAASPGGHVGRSREQVALVVVAARVGQHEFLNSIDAAADTWNEVVRFRPDAE